MCYGMIEHLFPRVREKREEQEPLLVCSDGEARPYKEAIAFEENLISGDVPSASWRGAVTRY